MTYTTVPVEPFRGLETGDADTGGAIDILNVRVDDPSRLRVRGGSEMLSTDATFTGTSAVLHYAPVVTTRPYILIGATGIRTYDTNGAFVADHAKTNLAGGAVAFNNLLLLARTTVGMCTYAAGTLTDLGSTPICRYLTTLPGESRVVAAYGTRAGLNGENVAWSDPGSHTSWPTTNTLQLEPQDSQTDDITALVTWRNDVYIFKVSKFFVATGTSATASGASQLNYRAVNVGIGCAVGGGAVAATDGVYFIGTDGIYRTQGTEPELISGPLQRWWDGESCPYFSVGSAYSTFTQIKADSQNLYCMTKNGSVSYTFVYSFLTRQWTVFDHTRSNIQAMAVRALRQVAYADSSGRLFKTIDTSTQGDETTTNGVYTDVASRYQLPFTDFGNEGEKVLREIALEGSVVSGADDNVNMWVATDWDTAEGTDTVTTGWGTSAEAALVRFRVATRGRRFALCIDEPSTPWTINRLVYKLRDSRVVK